MSSCIDDETIVMTGQPTIIIRTAFVTRRRRKKRDEYETGRGECRTLLLTMNRRADDTSGGNEYCVRARHTRRKNVVRKERTADGPPRLNLCRCRERARDTIGEMESNVSEDGKRHKRQKKGSMQEQKRGERRDGVDLCDRKNYSRMSDENKRIGSHPGAREWSRQRRGLITNVGGRDGDRIPDACAAGVGTCGHAQTILHLLFRTVASAISILLVLQLVRSLARSFLFPPSPSLFTPPLFLSLLLRGRTGKDHWSRPSAHDSRPRGRVVILAGVLSIWVITNANKDNTWRTIISYNYAAYRT